MSPVKRDSKCRQIQKHLESWICQQTLLPILIIGMELGKFDRFTRANLFFLFFRTRHTHSFVRRYLAMRQPFSTTAGFTHIMQ